MATTGGEAGSVRQPGFGYIRCAADLEGIGVNKTSVETFTAPISRQSGSYEIRFDWRLEGTRTETLNMIARTNLRRGPDETGEEPVQSELLSSASRADPSLHKSGTVRLETHLSEDVETVVSMELMLFTPGHVSDTQSGDFEMWVPLPDCDQEEQDTSEEDSDENDEECDIPRRVEVRPA